jgi:short-subunit dehydrogenase
LDIEEKDTDWKCIKADFGELSKISDYDYIYEECKGLDIGMLIINAGWGSPWFTHSTPRKWINDQVIMNVSQTPYLVRKFLPLMKSRHQQRGAIILVSSISAFMNGVYFALYMASKTYVMKYACCLYHELKADGIDVQAYCPSFVDTPLIKDSQ